MRSVSNVIGEIKELIEKHKVKEIKFLDDNLALKKEYLLEFCDEMIRNNIKIPWACSTGLRAANVNEEIVGALKKAGCYNFNIGIESANAGILKRIKKQETTEDFTKAINLADKHKILCGGFFIFGFPGETKETMLETVNFAKNSKLVSAIFNILDILPGSELWKDLNYKFDRTNIDNPYSQPRYLPKNLTAEDLIKYQRLALRKFYFRPKIFLKLFSSSFLKTKKTKKLFSSFFLKTKETKNLFILRRRTIPRRY